MIVFVKAATAAFTMFIAMADGESYSAPTTEQFCEKVKQLHDENETKKVNIIIADQSIFLADVIMIQCIDPEAAE